MKAATVTKDTAPVAAAKKKSQAQEVWRRFKKNREFKRRFDEAEENEEGDIRSFKFHHFDFDRFERRERRDDRRDDNRGRDGRRGDRRDDRRGSERGDRGRDRSGWGRDNRNGRGRDGWNNDRPGRSYDRGERNFNNRNRRNDYDR